MLWVAGFSSENAKGYMDVGKLTFESVVARPRQLKPMTAKGPLTPLQVWKDAGRVRPSVLTLRLAVTLA
ncbi:MAG: hypothetical protein JWQ73_883 [Variovorax sp.]|jgi:hypothetical protein|nr:hypothetical protein [Variovorax sp.]